MSENINFFDYIWSLFMIPVGYVATKYVNLSNRTTKNETDIQNICTQLNRIEAKLDKYSEDTNKLIGQFGEHLRKSE